MRKRWLVIVLLLVVVLAGGGAYAYYRLVLTPAQAEEQPTMQTTQVTTGDVIISADGSGTLLPSAEVSIGFQSSGLLKTLEVQVGDHVTAGQVLATLDTRDLELALQLAELQLAQAQANLDALDAGPSDTEVTIARNNLASAQDNLAQQQVSLAASTERARLSWITAANNLRDAQADYENIYWQNRSLEQKIGAENVPDSNYDNEAAALRAVQNAEASMEQARLSYETALKDQETSLKSAQYQVSTARANLEELYASATASQLLSAQVSLEQARIAHRQAQIDLENATLRAPIAGTVMTVDAAVGEQVGTGAIITLADMDAPLLELWVEEADMAAAQVGNRIHVVFDALPDLTFSGQIVRVDPALVTVSNISAVQAWATLDLSGNGTRLLSGMAAQVEVVQAEASNVLLVPLEALRDLGDGQYAVFVVRTDGSLEMRPVEVGLQDLVNAEIRSGLQAGETVRLVQSSSTGSAQSNTGNQTSPFGGGPVFVGPGFEGGGGPMP